MVSLCCGLPWKISAGSLKFSGTSDHPKAISRVGSSLCWKAAPLNNFQKKRKGRADPDLRREQLLDQLDLLELELDRRRAAEDADADLHPAAVEVEFFDHSVEAGEGA